MKEIHFIIDSGNTFTKVAQFHGDKLLELTSLPANKSLDLPKEAKGLFCSVNRDEPINSHLINLSSIKEKIKISTNYENSIGIDRQVLIYDLQKKGSSKFSVIIDAGSFITVDFTKDNLHLGGYIFPGVKNFLNIYAQKGKHLPQIELTETTSDYPLSTFEAINMATINYINSIVTLTAKCEKIILTGGDAKRLKPFFEEEKVCIKDNYLIYALNEVYKELLK